MIAVCQQPNYFPHLGYIEQCARADQLIMLDSVQWIKQGLHHRAKILPHLAQAAEESGTDFQWLSLPVQGKDHRTRTIADLELAENDPWFERHWKTLQAIYSGRPQFKNQFEPLLRPWFEDAKKYRFLSEVSVSSVLLCLSALDLSPEVNMSSTLHETGKKSERLISLCKSVNADIYYSGLASASYLDGQAFRDANIRLVWQRWKNQEYAQGRTVFKSHLSILDAFANVPMDEIKNWMEIKPWGPFGDLNACL